ncbi:hypothetical protein FA048_10790 [Pedobacter polaris]|uniref:Uncharacterized protein n=1 Tax=Pedobacter polaris TaxID=2571273 RepID=A0A4U1CU65_9SPHI|nr:hypothetical protein [Pedobacter polaris]TKC10655.1 hypothetical protein FA048_10790 [Pedobacter polaris]
MENQENNAGLGKNHDQAAHDHDIAKKQSEAKPAAENLDMMPNSVNKNGNKNFEAEDKDDKAIHHRADEYAKEEHTKADEWEDTSTK